MVPGPIGASNQQTSKHISNSVVSIEEQQDSKTTEKERIHSTCTTEEEIFGQKPRGKRTSTFLGRRADMTAWGRRVCWERLAHQSDREWMGLVLGV